MSPLTTIHLSQPAAVWVMCPTCWGQRQIFEDFNGEGLVPCMCPACLGLGQHLAGI